jgi:hypothetical protein
VDGGRLRFQDYFHSSGDPHEAPGSPAGKALVQVCAVPLAPKVFGWLTCVLAVGAWSRISTWHYEGVLGSGESQTDLERLVIWLYRRRLLSFTKRCQRARCQSLFVIAISRQKRKRII